VHGILDRQLAADPPSDLDGVFVVTAVDPGAVDSGRARMLAHRDALPEGDAERRVLDRVLAEPEAVLAASTVMTSLAQRRVVDRLVRRGVLQLGGFTPTDANHVLDRQATGDRLAALKGAGLLGRRRDRLGRPVADDATAVARLTIDTLVRRSAEAVLAAAFDHDGLPPETVSSRAVQASLDGHHGVARVEVGLTAPLVGLGASAGSYSPAVAALVRTTSVVPHDADVANAIGAVVGRVRVSHECTVSSPEPGRFVVHAGSGAHPTGSLADAVARATELVTAMVRAELVAAGAGEVELATDWHESTVEVGGTPMFVEGRLRVTGHGRPQL
jgi:N-methylhydantoinase A/oxoprolinase/acetone carboxylase beta subunit